METPQITSLSQPEVPDCGQLLLGHFSALLSALDAAAGEDRHGRGAVEAEATAGVWAGGVGVGWGWGGGGVGWLGKDLFCFLEGGERLPDTSYRWLQVKQRLEHMFFPQMSFFAHA